MFEYIIVCPACGKMYKCRKQDEQYFTDYNDNVTDHCVICKNKINPKILHTQDWIVDLVFKIKGN